MIDASSFIFLFRLRLLGPGSVGDASFRQVSGIAPEWQGVSWPDVGESRFEHRLPTGVTHACLTLEHAVAAWDSPLVQWCRDTLQGGLAAAVQPARDVEVSLLDADGNTLRHWSFTHAHPVRWTIEPFRSTGHDVAIEKLELAYSVAQRKS